MREERVGRAVRQRDQDPKWRSRSVSQPAICTLCCSVCGRGLAVCGSLQGHGGQCGCLLAGFLFPRSTIEEEKRVCSGGKRKLFCKEFVYNAEIMFLMATASAFLVILSLVSMRGVSVCMAGRDQTNCWMMSASDTLTKG